MTQLSGTSAPAMTPAGDLMAAFLAQVPDRVYFKDRDCRFVAVSASTFRSHGFSTPAEMIGKTDADFFEEAKARQFRAEEEQVMATGRPIVDQVVREVWADQRVTWAMVSRLPLHDAEGRIIGTIGIAKDVTQAKETEAALEKARSDLAAERARLKFIFEALPVGVSLMLPGPNEIHFSNPAHTRITGIPAHAQSNPEAFKRATHPDDLPAQEELVARYKRGEIDQFALEKRYVHPDGRIVWASLTRRMFVDPSTGERQSVTTLVDITDRMEAEAKLSDTYRKLADTSRLAGMAEVATGVLHNVGNVVNSVNVSASVVAAGARRLKIESLEKICALLRAHQPDLGTFLTQDPKGQRVIEFLESLTQSMREDRDRIVQELESLTRNVEHIKEIVAMQQSYATMVGVVEPLDPAALMDDALRVNSAALLRHAVRVVRDFQAVPPVLAERGKVLQILVNLIRNAKYACDEGGNPDKVLTLGIEPGDARHVHLVVRDNGVGIPAENLTRIFTHGFTTRATGHGFGLHSSANAAKEMKGTLSAQSAGPGQGATFVLALPIADPGASV